jgi:hypothetical protein
MASITIPLYYDLDLLLWTSAVGGIARQPNLVLGQSDSIDFAVQFVRSGVVIELTSPQFICGIKPINDVAGDYLCLTTTAVKTGSTTSTVYTFTLLLDSDELRAWLLTVTAVSNYAAFSIRDTVNLIATLPAITCTILPDYTLEGTTPTAASGTLIVDSGATFTVHKTFAMPTTDGFNNYVLKTNGAGVGSWAVDSAGTGTVQSVSVTTANGVSGTVVTSTTTPAITIALAAITPTTGAFSSTTDSSSHTTGAVTIAGGLGVSRNLYVNANASFNEDASFNSDIILSGVLQARYFNSTNNLPSLQLPPVDGSVNYLTIEQSATTLPVHILAQGTDTNIGLHLQAKGTGFVNVQDGTDTTKRLRFSASGNGTGIITTLASSSTTSQTITLPNATTATTLAGLQMIQTFSAAQTFSSTVGLTLGTDATNSTTGGTLTVTGGAAVSKKLFVGTLLDLVATTATAGQITQAGARLLHTYGGGGNLFLGTGAGTLTSSGTGHNCGIGYGALASLGANNGYNTGLGSYALNGVTSGSGNMGIGYSAAGNANCSNTTAIGFQSLNGTSGGNNVAVGFNTGQATGSIGGLTSLAITTGDNNTLLGTNAGITSVTGTYRTAIGSGSRCQSNNAIKLGRDYSASNAGDITILAQIPTANLPAASADNKGAIVYNTTDNVLYFSNGTIWAAV